MDTDTLNHWRQTIKRILRDLSAVPFPAFAKLESKTVFDEKADIYLVIIEGWEDVRRMHGVLVHVDIIDGKIWIQEDGTEDGIARDLLEAGIPKDKIVLGFKSPETRKYTGYAVA
jgi:hypothetical protein